MKYKQKKTKKVWDLAKKRICGEINEKKQQLNKLFKVESITDF